MGMTCHGIPTDRCIGGNHAIKARLTQGGCHEPDTVIVHVRGDLHSHRHVPAMLLLTLELFVLDGLQQALQRVSKLQIPKAGRVGRGHIHRYVIGPTVNCRNSLPVIGLGLVVGRVLVLANIDSKHALVAALIHTGQQVVQSLVIETHPVNDGLMLQQPKHPWFGVAGLRQRRHGTDFNKTEAQGAKRIEVIGVLIQTCGKPDGVRKIQPHNIHWQ